MVDLLSYLSSSYAGIIRVRFVGSVPWLTLARGRLSAWSPALPSDV